MPQSFARLHIHLVFSTKHRAPLLAEAVREQFHGYVARVLQNLDCPALLINSVADHVHILFELARTAALSEVVQELKQASSKWLKTQGDEFADFSWQAGYGAFSVSESQTEGVKAYIAGQAEHHRKKSFQEEFRTFLERHGFKIEERYVWD